MPRISTPWLHRDAKLVRSHHRKLWPQVRDSFEPELYDLALRRSLRSLAQQGYGMDEASVIFGVSRQRVQQWCERYRLGGAFKAAGMGTKHRVWDRQLKRFVPLLGEDLKRLQIAQRERQRAERRKLARRESVEQLRSFAAELGRIPSLDEAGALFGTEWQTQVLRFRGRSRRALPIPWGSLIRRWYRLAGLEVRPVGGPGHLLVGQKGPGG